MGYDVGIQSHNICCGDMMRGYSHMLWGCVYLLDTIDIAPPGPENAVRGIADVVGGRGHPWYGGWTSHGWRLP